ncbi:MAG TPA: hypothetical protein PK536_02685 [Ignavibacteria bacterium]|nr:hypothetical protein [Ignavibacteria bacterium]
MNLRNLTLKISSIKYLILLMLLNEAASAQISSVMTDSVYNTNIFQTNLYNDLNSSNLSSILNYGKSSGRFGFNLSNTFLSNVSKLNRNFFRDYNNLKLLLYYSALENLNTGVGFQNKFFTDDRNIQTNQNKSSYIYANADARIRGSIFINSKLGFKAEDQIGEFNSGPSGYFEAQAINYDVNEYLTNGRLILFYENLDQKINHNYELNADIYKRFASLSDNKGMLRYYNQKNDFYFPASPGISQIYGVKNNIEKRSENFIYIGDILNYGFSKDVMLSLGGSFQNRNITREYKYKPPSSTILFENTYDNRIIENNLEIYSNLNYVWEDLYSQLRIILNERSENHSLINTEGLTSSQISELEKAEKNKNNNSRRTSMLLNVYYPVSNTNSFAFTGSTSLLRYDTDFQQNYDDRDETESIIAASHIFNNLFNFDTETKFEFIESKLSYIFSQRSANNYRNRIYRLSSYSNFRPAERFITKNFFQVSANYTVYDYEDLISQIQSFSYRQLSIRDSSSYNFGKGLKINFAGELKFYEQGEFLNNSFSVKPIAFYTEQFYMPEINYLFKNFLNFGIGYKYFSQHRYNYDESEKVLSNIYKSFGPMGRAEIYMNNNSSVNFLIGLDKIEYINPSQSNSSLNFQLNILWNM